MEFTVLFALMFFVFLFMTGLIIRSMEKNQLNTEYSKLGLLSEKVKSKIMLAYESKSNFESSFCLDSTLQGADYNLTIDPLSRNTFKILNKEMDISMMSNIPRIETIPNVDGSLVPGNGYIIKNKGGSVEIEDCPSCTCP